MAGLHRLRVDYAAGAAAPRVELRWTASAVAIPALNLAPRYANVVKTTVFDSVAGDRVSAYDYHSLADGLVRSATTDPGTGHLALTTQTTYETTASGHFMRPLSSALPAGDPAVPAASTTYSYYSTFAPDTGPIANPCTTGSPHQGGALSHVTSPAGSNGAQAVDFAYDVAGRVVGTHRNTEATWTCTTYDPRGRISTRSIAGGARTVSFDYAVGANPFVSSVADGSGTITTTVDLLGRTRAYVDASAQQSTSTYDQAGRLVTADGPGGRRDTKYEGFRTKEQDYADTGAILAGPALATPTYSTATGELTSVAYANGSALAAVVPDGAGRTTRLTWTATGATPLADDLVGRSPAGLVVNEAVDGGAVSPNFTYDGAGRLTAASAGGHGLAYAFAPTGGCGPATGAGRNTNRTSVADTLGGTTTTKTFCYDGADGLVTSTDVGTVGYDGHANVNRLGNQAFTYDDADRHTRTDIDSGPTVTYVRDATDRIIS
ncbi:MAG: hypothetical protein LC721_04095, partial [Actinobacteria bacterium]|nr:hypothetical protein [Actinomycetota bacterium]